MSMTARTTIAFDAQSQARLKEVGEKFDISYARLLACLLALPDEQIKGAIDAHYGNLFKNAAERRAEKKEKMKLVESLSAADLAALIAAKNSEVTA